MQINLEALPPQADERLREFVTQKVERLGKFYARIVEADVFLKSGNDPENGAVAEIRLNVPQDTLFCEEHAPTFEEAIDKCSHAMERQVKRYKDKHASHA